MKRIFLLIFILLLVALNLGVASGEEQSTRKLNLIPKEKGIGIGGIIFLPGGGKLLVMGDEIIPIGPGELYSIDGCETPYNPKTVCYLESGTIRYTRYVSVDGQTVHGIECLDGQRCTNLSEIMPPKTFVVSIKISDYYRALIKSGNINLMNEKYDDAIWCFTEALEMALIIGYGGAEAYGGLARAFYFKGEYALSSLNYAISRYLGMEPNPFLEALIFMGPNEISYESMLVLDDAFILKDDVLNLVGKNGRVIKIQSTMRIRFSLRNMPDWMPPFLYEYRIKSTGKTYLEIHVPEEWVK